MLVQGKLLSYGDDFSEAFAIRRKVFVEEQGIPENIEFDDLDTEAMHVIVFEDQDTKKAVATGRIIYDGLTCQIGHIAVLKEYRGKKYGDFAVRMLLNKAFSVDVKEVTIDAQLSNVDFYKKIGFQTLGMKFVKSDVLFTKMTIYAKDIVTLCKISAKLKEFI